MSDTQPSSNETHRHSTEVVECQTGILPGAIVLATIIVAFIAARIAHTQGLHREFVLTLSVGCVFLVGGAVMLIKGWYPKN